MINVMYGCVCMYNTIHQSQILVNVRFSLINTFAEMQCSATLKGRSFAQTHTHGLGPGTRLNTAMNFFTGDYCLIACRQLAMVEVSAVVGKNE